MRRDRMEKFEIFPWDYNFETGIQIIDEQHQQLVNILNRLASHLANLSTVETLNDIFDELANYADYHFKTEEGIWRRHFKNDVWFLEHEKTHASFINDVITLKNNEQNKEFDEVIYDVVLFLSKWLAYHILDTDKRMAKVVLALESGFSIEAAKQHSIDDMSGSMQTLIETVLKMYSDISTRTLDLMREQALRKKAEQALKVSQERLKFILDSSNENIWDWDIQNDKAKKSSKSVEFNDILKTEMKEYDGESNIHPDDIEQVKAEFQAHLDGETEFYNNKHRVIRNDGSWAWVYSRGKVISRDKDGKALRIIGTHSDVTERELASIIYNNSSQAMFVSDGKNKIISVNPSFSKITGYFIEDVIGKDPKILASGEVDRGLYKEMWAELNNTKKWSGELINKRKNGELYVQELMINVVKNNENNIDHYVALFSDISEKKKADSIIEKQANYDSLTQLENRRMFYTRLTQEIQRSKRTKFPFAVLFIDLDHFKDVNDTLGHHIGDKVLIEAAQRIHSMIRDIDILARFGGDEFTLILSNIKETIALERISKSIIDSLEEAFILENSTKIYLSASIGITLYPEDALDENSLLKNADQAMYQAKKTGRGRFNYFTKHMQVLAQKRQLLLGDLHIALKQNQFQMYYQPIVDLKSGDVNKAEALIRWNHPSLGLISPNDFISLAEESGLIVEIGDWVFKEATNQAKEWKEQYSADFKISINKSPVQFKKTNNLDTWMEYLTKIALSGENIVIEITESLLVENDHHVVQKLLKFRDEGIEVAIDDFGTGYSSLSYLKKFDIDYIKIDKSFVDNLATSSQDTVLCEAMIAMAHKLGIKVIAEGIEDKTQKEILQSMDCDYGQGYFYAKPLPADTFESMFFHQNNS